ncbi:hypothetical protein [Acuticoccus sediminis]|uniref:hypothetical protein n=1 Tax=Acuticoccus sediminis TaxID=2184697 RepID=UPI0011B93BC8|nr:hypothetical protein [Acuticoccus sediminis]
MAKRQVINCGEPEEALQVGAAPHWRSDDFGGIVFSVDAPGLADPALEQFGNDQRGCLQTSRSSDRQEPCRCSFQDAKAAHALNIYLKARDRSDQ